MFVFNFKMKSSKIPIIFFAVMSAAAAIVCIACMTKMQGKPPSSATCDEIGTYTLQAGNTEEQCLFLEQFGFEPYSENFQSSEVIIPSEFNTVYDEYNELQKKVGLDLSKYKGKNVQKVTYPLKNTDNETAVLLVFRDTVIGGHITNGEYGEDNKPLNCYGKN